jgi:hypothetical protein
MVVCEYTHTHSSTAQQAGWPHPTHTHQGGRSAQDQATQTHGQGRTAPHHPQGWGPGAQAPPMRQRPKGAPNPKQGAGPRPCVSDTPPPPTPTQFSTPRSKNQKWGVQ